MTDTVILSAAPVILSAAPVILSAAKDLRMPITASEMLRRLTRLSMTETR